MPRGGAANVHFVCRRGKMDKETSLSIPPSRIVLRSITKFTILLDTTEFYWSVDFHFSVSFLAWEITH